MHAKMSPPFEAVVGSVVHSFWFFGKGFRAVSRAAEAHSDCLSSIEAPARRCLLLAVV